MTRPAPIHGRYGRTYKWDKLDPEQAYMGAQWGLRGPKGSTFLLTPCDLYPDYDWRIVAVGLWSGICNMHPDGTLTGDTIGREIESLETCHPGMTDMDHRIKPAVYKSWIVEG